MAGTLEYPSMSPPGPLAQDPEPPLAPDEEDEGAWSPPDAPLAEEEASLATPAPGRQTERLVAEFAKTRDPRLRDRIVLMHDRMVRYLASRFDSRLSPQEDVVQVAYIGLISALDRFDPKKGGSFITYAIPTIVGEIKRYFRDQTWVLKAPRKLRDLGLNLKKLRQELEQKLGRAPSVQEMAEAAQVSEERLLQAMEVNRAYVPCSLDTCLYGRDGSRKGPVSECVGESDAEIQCIEERDAFQQAIALLNTRQQQIIQLRFYDELSQAEVARQLGVSQMHISRLERQALRDLQRILSN
jgi:RNA polymerase sigma-B factor